MKRQVGTVWSTARIACVMLALCLLLALGNVTPVHAGAAIDNSSWSNNALDAAPGTNWTKQKEAGVLQIKTRQVSSGSYAATATLTGDDRWAGVEGALKIRPPQPPTDITLSNSTIAAAALPGTVVGTLTATDPDTCGDETYTFSLVSGTGDADNGSFTIDGNQLKTSTSLAPGTYSIRVNVNDGTCDFAKVSSITVSAYPAITGGVTEYGDYMTNVTFAGIDHDSGNDNGYADYTALAASVSAGSTYPLACIINVGDGMYPAVVVAWIDWNQNYSFDDVGEKYVIGTNLNLTGPNTASADIAVPADALGGSTRMRIVMNALDGTTEPPNAGSDMFWGDAEDYTAVELAWFTATVRDGAIALVWETASEIDLLGFHVYRQAAEGELVRLNAALLPSQAPGSPVGGSYEFVDEAVAPGVTYWYWLADVDVHGAATLHGPVSASLAPLRRLLPVRPRLAPEPHGLRSR
jgi:hypothetical protein